MFIKLPDSKLVALLWLIICFYVLSIHNCSLIFMILFCYVLSIHKCSLIVVKQIGNIDTEISEYLEKPYRKNNMIVGAPMHDKAASNNVIWLAPAFLSRRSACSHI